MKRIIMSLPLVLILASLLLPGTGALAAEPPQRVIYEVDLTHAGEGTLTVTMRVDAGPQPLVLEMPDTYGNGLAAGLSSHVEEERASDPSGNPLPVSRNGSSWSIEHSGGVTFSYALRLQGYEAGTDYLDSLARSGAPWPYYPTLDADLAYLPGYAVFVRPLGSQYTPSLELKMPAQWQQALPWPEQPADMDELLNNAIYAGELSLSEQGSLLVAAPAGTAAAAEGSLTEFGGKARTLMEKAESLLGGLDLEEGHRLVLALLFRGEGVAVGSHYYPSSPFSSSIVIPAAAGNDPLSDAIIEATARGMSSLLISEELKVESESEWLLQGSSWYLQDLLPYASGLWGANLFWDRFNLSYDTYRTARAASTASLAQAGTLGYESWEAAVILTCGGATACASIDSELRSQQPYALDLTTFLGNLAEMASAEDPLNNAETAAALTNLTGLDWTAFFRDYIEGTEEIPASAFSSLNIVEPGSSGVAPETPEEEASPSDWIFIIVAVLVVFLIPFVLEPYTMRPRKPGFLERELAKDDED
jgi:Peptidase M61 N-terminal domain